MIETTHSKNAINYALPMSNVTYSCMAHVLKSTETANYTKKDANGTVIIE
jgi:hypothetical protein